MPLCAQEPLVPSTATETNPAKKGRSCKLATGSCRSAKSRGTAGVQRTFKGQAELGAEHRRSRHPAPLPQPLHLLCLQMGTAKQQTALPALPARESSVHSLAHRLAHCSRFMLPYTPRIHRPPKGTPFFQASLPPYS